MLAKGIELLAHKVTLISTKLYILWVANKALSKCYRAKKNCICQGGVLTIENIHNIITKEEVDKQIQHNKHSKGVNRKGGILTLQHYSIYGKTGHNSQTC